MIAAFALILLADAPASCALPGSERLGGDARLVRPGVTFEPMAVGPSRGVDSKLRLAAAPAEAEQESDSGQPADQCEAAPLPIA
jgi:hypothetical protein